MAEIIECVPNVSEGRNYRTIEKLSNTIRAVEKVQLLDVHRDIDHNRSVFTFIGTPVGVFEAAYNMTEQALELIDINKNDGVHPFIGAVDVIPFIPVKNSTLEDCVKVAHKLGADLEKHLHLPVYFYEEATNDPKTKNLADLRAQGYNLKKHRTAGAVAIGARNYLVAYNVNLNTTKLVIAKDIANKIREKNGGLKGIKALGFKIASKKQVQVSINIVNPKLISVKKLTSEISKLAAQAKVEITSTELVGLMPGQVEEATKSFE